jgi:hypothetical protein
MLFTALGRPEAMLRFINIRPLDRGLPLANRTGPDIISVQMHRSIFLDVEWRSMPITRHNPNPPPVWLVAKIARATGGGL